jgi:hypothetical protein
MKALPGTQWVDSNSNVIIAQVNISNEEIAALGGIVERSDSALGPTEVAVFTLETGRMILLYRTENNPVPGYTLIVAGSDYSGVLDEFLREAALDRGRVTIVMDQS